MGANARLHANQTGRDIGGPALKLVARELGFKDSGPALVEANTLLPMSMPITAIDALDFAALVCTGMGGSWDPVTRSSPDTWNTAGPSPLAVFEAPREGYVIAKLVSHSVRSEKLHARGG
jgi:hypothetical protein